MSPQGLFCKLRWPVEARCTVESFLLIQCLSYPTGERIVFPKVSQAALCQTRLAQRIVDTKAHSRNIFRIEDAAFDTVSTPPVLASLVFLQCMHTLSRACLKASSYQTLPLFDTYAKFCSKHAFAQLLFGRTSARATRFGEKLSNR